MKVSIIVFSPSGHTLQVAQLFKKEFESSGSNVQLINITKNRKYLHNHNIKLNLESVLKTHDVLLIGGPVYAGHVEKNILQIIEQLPDPGDKYSPLVVPFVSYGGVHSSIALEEMGKYLKQQKRKSILGVKISAEHTLTKTLSKVINRDMPGESEEKVIADAAVRIVEILEHDSKIIKDISKSFSYSKLSERILFRIFSQESLHKKFKDVSIDTKKCIKCKKCISVCPLNMFDYSDGIVRMVRDKTECILCAECYHVCPAGAINHPYIEIGRKRLKDGNIELEKEPSVIYPAAT